MLTKTFVIMRYQKDPVSYRTIQGTLSHQYVEQSLTYKQILTMRCYVITYRITHSDIVPLLYRSLSQSPRIVSLQVELGFVSVTSADLDLLQSKYNGKCDVPTV